MSGSLFSFHSLNISGVTEAASPLMDLKTSPRLTLKPTVTCREVDPHLTRKLVGFLFDDRAVQGNALRSHLLYPYNYRNNALSIVLLCKKRIFFWFPENNPA